MTTNETANIAIKATPKTKRIVITRKIQINFDVPKEKLKECYDIIFGYQRIVHHAANHVMTHQHMLKAVRDDYMFTDEVKKKIANIDNDEDGILTTSKEASTYQLLSKKFKGICPMGMLSAVNRNVIAKYETIAKDLYLGRTSLPTFSSSMPMPIRIADVRDWKQNIDEYGNFTFHIYKLSFKTFFGADKSNNKSILDRAVFGREGYKLCDSSIKLEKHGGKWKMFLLAAVSFEQSPFAADPEKVAVCRLGIEHPIIILQKSNKFFGIGTAEEFLHRRMAIRNALSRLQKASKYNVGGKGRKKKLVSIERFKNKEDNYVESRMHLYSRMLIDYCLKNNIGKIVLDNYKEVVEKTHEDTDQSRLLLSSWSYYGLSQKIKYKATKFGIEIEISDDENAG